MVWCGVVWCGVVWYGCSVTHRTDESVPAMFGAAPAAVGEQRTEALLGRAATLTSGNTSTTHLVFPEL